ncbi:MAG: hypothetical protein WA705_15960 [Candidatus Ozemobacteraceae bacterium]
MTFRRLAFIVFFGMAVVSAMLFLTRPLVSGYLFPTSSTTARFDPFPRSMPLPSPTAKPDEIEACAACIRSFGEDPIGYTLKKLETYDLVILGENHFWADNFSFYEALVASAGTGGVVRDIVLEAHCRVEAGDYSPTPPTDPDLTD